MVQGTGRKDTIYSPKVEKVKNIMDIMLELNKKVS